MAARLGHVLYWLACLLAAGSIAIGFGLMLSDNLTLTQAQPILLTMGAIALAIWATGWAIRYVLAGH